VFGLGKIDGYTALTNLINDHFIVSPGRLDNEVPANFFEFPYDWRLSNRHSATRLRDLVNTRLTRHRAPLRRLFVKAPRAGSWRYHD